MHSQGNTSSRMKFNYPVNDGSSPHTVVRAWMRGAPDNGKNSYVSLIEQFCADNPSNNFCDEIDIVEYYGQPSAPRSEFTIHQNGQRDNVGFMVWPAPADPGHIQTSYDIYLEPGNYLSWHLYAPNGLTLGSWDRHSSDGYVPSRSMNEPLRRHLGHRLHRHQCRPPRILHRRLLDGSERDPGLD